MKKEAQQRHGTYKWKDQKKEKNRLTHACGENLLGSRNRRRIHVLEQNDDAELIRLQYFSHTLLTLCSCLLQQSENETQQT